MPVRIFNLVKLGNIWARLSTFANQGIFQSAKILIIGTIVGHAITMSVMPLLTRIYTPEDFSVAQIFSSICAIFVPIACFRYDIAIPLPAKKIDGIRILIVSIICAAITSIVLSFLIYIIPFSFFKFAGLVEVYDLLAFIPIAVFFGGLYQSLQMSAVRSAKFRQIATSRILQSTSMVAGQLGFGLTGFGPAGLIVGQALNSFTGTVALGFRLRHQTTQIRAGLRLGKLSEIAFQFKRFPQYSIGEALANSAALHLPFLIMARFSSLSEIGFLTLAWFVLQTPLALVGHAVGQAYLAGAPTARRRDELGKYTIGVIKNLAIVSSVPIGLLVLCGPSLFPLIFGSNWERSGWILLWMGPWCFFQLIASPVSSLLMIVEKQRMALQLQLIGLVIRAGIVTLCGIFSTGYLPEIYALSGGLFYAIYLIVIIRISASCDN